MLDFVRQAGTGQHLLAGPLQSHLEALTEELAKGQAGLRELERQEMALRETLLQISGAIQVLQELLSEGSAPANGMAGTPSPRPPQPIRNPSVLVPLWDVARDREGLGRD